MNQSLSRSLERIPSVDDFIQSRRATIGAALVEGTGSNLIVYQRDADVCLLLAMVEYSLDLDIPDYVFSNPIVKAISDATSDLMSWPNVCYLTI